jgi:hypothetical protein
MAQKVKVFTGEAACIEKIYADDPALLTHNLKGHLRPPARTATNIHQDIPPLYDFRLPIDLIQLICGP